MGCSCFRGFQFCWPHVMRFLHPRHGTTTSEAATVPGLHLISMGRIRGDALAR
jgi:hypothetical protein